MSKLNLKELNQNQKKAVMFGEGPLLILAGAGSGKTRALTYRVAYLIKEKKVNPNRILLVTFTNKAAGEMKERVNKLVGSSKLPWAGTFHSLGARILRIEGEKIGIDRQFLIFDEEDSRGVIKKAMDNLKIDKKEVKPRIVKAMISSAKNELISSLEYNQIAKTQRQKIAARVWLEYERLLKNYKALDFDDLLNKTVELFKKQKQIRDKYADRFLYVLVDEYQDTNKAQYELTKLLSSRWRNLGVVGDASQSIYGFRGADYRNLVNLKNDFKDLKIINLERNYRSTKNILKAAYGVIHKNTSHPVLKLWTEKSGGGKLKVFEADSEKEEADFVVKQIQKEGLLKFKQTAVLYRTNAQSRAIEEALIKAGIPYALVGGVRFYGRKEIKDCLAYLRLIANPLDMISLKRIEKIGKRRMKKFLNWLGKGEKDLMTKELLNQVLKVTGYLDFFDKKDEQDLMRLENIKELKSVAEEYPDLLNFLEKVALVEQTELAAIRDKKGGLKQKGKAVKKENQVTLMTFHASKGLEFETVLMVGMEEGLFPHSRSMFDREELEEERRLCYVGITRAKKNLFLSYANRRLYFGYRSRNQVSRFLADIDEQLLEPIGRKGLQFEDTGENFNDIIKVNDY